VSEPTTPPSNVPPQPPATGTTGGFIGWATRLPVKRGASGVLVPLVTVVFAFLMGGVVIAATQQGGFGTRIHNTLVAYNQIFDGAGLNWFGHFFRHACFGFIPCHAATTNVLHDPAAYNLSQTLLSTTTLILTGLAVAFAFRCGMFNIGGQGQYFVGLIAASWVGVDFAGMSKLPHILLAIAAATLAGAAWAGIAGVLKATVGAHEVISTIMLNWIAIWVAEWLVGDGGPLQNPLTPFVPGTANVAPSAQLPAFWGVSGQQALDYGLFIAIGALIVYWLVLNRTTLGYEVQAVGFNPDAAAYGGISVRKNLIRAMAISGAFAGLAGAVDMLGYLYNITQLDIPVSQVGFLGIAVALLGRLNAVGMFFSALLFGGLLYGTTHGLQGVTTTPVVSPELAGNLTFIIVGLVVLFVSAPFLISSVWDARKKLRPTRKVGAVANPTEAAA
jgi:general nucleoside transport system permease protein